MDGSGSQWTLDRPHPANKIELSVHHDCSNQRTTWIERRNYKTLIGIRHRAGIDYSGAVLK